MIKKAVVILALRGSLFFIALLPFLLMLQDTVYQNLGANPVEALLERSGFWALCLLLITLSCTPIRLIFRQSDIIKFRRMLGLYAFFYSTIHFAIFIGLEHALNWQEIIIALQLSPLVDVGLLAYLLMLPLALTSRNAMRRKLGKNWQRIHNTIYLTAILSVLHYALSVKSDITDPLLYAFILLILLVIRGVFRNRRKSKRISGSMTK